jgi:Tfp pilus assembly protein PilW
LIEIVVTLALAGIVAAAATSATISVYRSTRQLEQEAAVDEDSKILLDNIKTRLRQLGGGSLRPWMAISNKCAKIPAPASNNTVPATCTNGSTGQDMIHFIDVNPNLDQCAIATFTTGGTVATVATVSGSCCLSAWGDGTTLPVNLVPAGPGRGWIPRTCAVQSSGGQCKCTLTKDAQAVDVPTNDGTPVANAEWTGGLIVPGTSLTYWVKTAAAPTTQHELHVVDDFNTDGTYQDRVLHDFTYDLQLQFGYDYAQDGTFNGTWTDDRPDTTTATSLRMVRVGLIVGAAAPTVVGASKALSLNGSVVGDDNNDLGPQRPHVRVRRAVGATALRNLLFFY